MKRGCGRAVLAYLTGALVLAGSFCTAGTVAFAAEHDPVTQGYLTADFEDDYQPFQMRSGKEIKVVTEGRDGNHVLLVSGRKDTWDGWSVDVTDWFVRGREYTFSAYLKQTERETQKVNLSIELKKPDGSMSYIGLQNNILLPSNVWKEVKINFYAPDRDYVKAKLYMQSGNDNTFDFMTDEISVAPASGRTIYEAAIAAPSLKEAYQNDFRMGMSHSFARLRNDKFREMLQHQFNSATYGNELKPDYILDQQASQASPDGSPEINYARLDEILSLARDSGVQLRGHVLVWHAQTPEWFFKVGYDKKNHDVDSATMEMRMEQYIRKVLTYTQSKYPGVIYAWDVVNEAADENGGYRKNSGWYRIMGEGFIEKAFTYARKYAAPGVKLFYNDYNEYHIRKRDTIYGWVTELQKKGLIDGVGMQSHVDLKDTTVEEYLEAVELYGSTGLEVHVTELDIHNPDPGIAGQMKLADKYTDIMSGLCRLKESGKANITCVTIWGFSDAETWLTQNRGEVSYPLLFDEAGRPKDAFWGVMDVKVPGSRKQYQTKW